MKAEKTISMLSSISNFKTYSKYNEILKKRFSDYSLKHLINTLKKPKYFVKPNFLEEFVKKYPYESGQFPQKNITKNKTCSLSNNNDDTILSNEDQHKSPKNATINFWTLKSLNTPKKFYEPEPDPFRYNPNYNSIFKNIPCAKIFEPSKESIEAKNRKNKQFLTYGNGFNKKERKHNKTAQKTDQKKLMKLNPDELKYLGIEDKKNKTVSINLLRNKSKNRGQKYFNSTKDNHTLRFNDYIPRKDNCFFVNDKITYLEPHNYDSDKNNAVDFKKMPERSEQIFINTHSLSIPSSYFYNPKYTYVEGKQAETIIKPKEKKVYKPKSRKLRLRKLWTSYNVGELYELVDNKKLNYQSDN